MHPPLRHRVLAAVAALSLVVSAVPVSMGAAPADPGIDAAFGTSDPEPESAIDGTGTRLAAPASGATAPDEEGMSCEPGPCSMLLTTCLGAGSCITVAPLPAYAVQLSSSREDVTIVHTGERRMASTSPRLPTPPPRG